MYNTDFQIIIYKLTNSRKILPNELKLLAFLHKIDNIDPDFVKVNWSANHTKIAAVLEIIEGLIDEGQKSTYSTVLSVHTKNIKEGRFKNQNYIDRQNCGAPYFDKLRDPEICSNCDTKLHDKSSSRKKYGTKTLTY